MKMVFSGQIEFVNSPAPHQWDRGIEFCEECGFFHDNQGDVVNDPKFLVPFEALPKEYWGYAEEGEIFYSRVKGELISIDDQGVVRLYSVSE